MTTHDRSCIPLLLQEWLATGYSGTATVRAFKPERLAVVLTVDAGRVLAAELAEGGAADVVDIVSELFELEARGAELVPGPVASHDGQPGVPIQDLLLHSVRRVGNALSVLKWIGPPETRLRLDVDPFHFFEQTPLTPGEAFFVSRLEGAMTAPEMVGLEVVDNDTALRVICALRLAGALVEVAPKTVEPPRLDPVEAARVCYEMEEKSRAIEGGADYYAILEVEHRATMDAIRDAYIEIASRFHPKQHGLLVASDPAIGVKLDSIVNAASHAYVTLSEPMSRAAYDVRIADEAKRSYGERASAPQSCDGDSARGLDLVEEPSRVQSAATSPHVKSFIGVMFFRRGSDLSKKGDYVGASRAFKQGLEVAPGDAKLHAALGRSLTRVPGCHKDAEASLLKAIELEPTSSQHYLDLASVYEVQWRNEEARRWLLKALAYRPDDAKVRAALERIGSTSSPDGSRSKQLASR